MSLTHPLQRSGMCSLQNVFTIECVLYRMCSLESSGTSTPEKRCIQTHARGMAVHELMPGVHSSARSEEVHPEQMRAIPALGAYID
jgi:hypothetical protein